MLNKLLLLLILLNLNLNFAKRKTIYKLKDLKSKALELRAGFLAKKVKIRAREIQIQMSDLTLAHLNGKSGGRRRFGSGSTSPWVENDTIEAFLAEGAGCNVIFGWTWYTWWTKREGEAREKTNSLQGEKMGDSLGLLYVGIYIQPWNGQGENPMEDDDGGRPPDAPPSYHLRFPKAPMDEMDELATSDRSRLRNP
ncbi:hypothetical protein F5050DRAFT_1905234 [Lentinula boryana]|uniref:Uncharacterized protein n=1 Tax=Lentinula boryana TaxID=40481 RepID=A0ABQ8Q462_9AGAR|nr:hypothetical protein F5050DRAFT_1905234 [Lentinula boryana]